MGFLPSGGRRMNYGISATSAIRWQKWQKDMNYGISATSAIRWQKWQKDELWDFCHFCHHAGGKSGRRMNYGISATSAIRWQKWQKDMNYGISAIR